MTEASRRAAEVALERTHNVEWLATLLDQFAARAVEEERERILAFMGDGISEWHRAALRAPEEKA